MHVVYRSVVITLLTCVCMSSAFAIAPGTPIVNNASVTFELRGHTHVVVDDDTLVAAADAGNSPPHGLSLDPPQVPENHAGSDVGVFLVADLDPADSHTFSLTDPRFRIVDGRLLLGPGVSLDHEQAAEVRVAITVRDAAGGEFAGEVIVSVLDVNEPPSPIEVPDQTLTADAAGVVVATLSVSDPDDGDTLTLTVDDDRFVIIGHELRLRPDQALAVGEHLVLTITATDTGGLVTRGSFSVRAQPGQGNSSSARIGRLDSQGDATPLSLARCEGAVSPVIDLDLPGVYGVISDQAVPVDQPAILEVVDLDANVLAGVRESVWVKVSSDLGDQERVELSETGPDTGVFTAVLGLTTQGNGGVDCRLQVRLSDGIRLDYEDGRDPLDRAVASARIVPAHHLPTAATLTLHTYAPAQSGLPLLHVQPGRCGAAAAPMPRLPDGTAVPLPADLPVLETTRFLPGEAAFIRVVDPDQNRQPLQLETLEVRLTQGAFTTALRLQETALDSGIFAGYVNSGVGGAIGCASINPGVGSFVIDYVDPDDSNDRVRAEADFAGYFRVFSSHTGQLLDGVEVTLVDDTTAQVAGAAVWSADGSAAIPAVQRSGSAFTDSAGRSYQPPPGSVLFPRVKAGRYRLQVTPAPEFRFPSSRTDAELQRVGEGHYRTPAGARGESFVISTNDSPSFDLPLDPVSASVFVTKEASTETAEPGDFIQYRVRVQSGSDSIGGPDALLIDQLPQGFRYRRGSARLDAQPIEPEIDATGLALSFPLATAGSSRAVSLTYVAEVTIAARQGNARNTVTLHTSGLWPQPSATADVLIRNAQFGERGFVVGEVRQGCAADAPGVEGIRVLLETGAYALTDSSGRFHFEDLKAGTHVVQLDPSTLPVALAPIVCRQHSRLDQEGSAQFVELERGGLARVGFVLADAPPPVTEWSVQLDANATPGSIDYNLALQLGALGASRGTVGLILPPGLDYLTGTARLNGEPLPEPTQLDRGALTFVLPPLRANTLYRLTLRTHQQPNVERPQVKAMVTLTTSSGRHRSSVVQNTVQVDPAPAAMQAVPASGQNPRFIPGSATVMGMVLPVAAADPPPYSIPPIDNGDVPEFSAQWLSTRPLATELVWPGEHYNPRIPAVPVVVMHPTTLRPVLSVDGRLVNSVAFEGTTTSHERGLTLSRWKDVPISEAQSRLKVQFIDADDRVVEEIERTVHFGQAPVRAELVEAQSYLVADGVHPPLLAVRFFDREDRPARPGLTGEFAVNAPFEPLDKAKDLVATKADGSQRLYQVRQDGVAYIQLEPTTRTGDVVLTLVFGEQRQDKLRTRLRPGRQDLVVVGLAESRVGQGVRADRDDLSSRVAFYAKGMVRGDWLVTAAYDDDKQTDTSQFAQVDPGQFYPLFGDGSEQRLDAVSQRSFYLKAERDDYEFEAGDFNTGFERSELARYDRTLNGVRAAMHGKRTRLEVFASDTGTTHVQDQLRPDGTSGLYRLSRAPLVGGTDRVSIVVRDRLHTERVLERQTLMRYLDYSIDPDRGTVLFKQPIQAQDASFNPVFIEVNYDVDGGGSGKDLVVGTRAAVALDDADSELGLTMLRDQAAGAALELDAVDLHLRLTPTTRLQLEAARSDGAVTGAAHAYVAALAHQGKRAAGQLYYRQQDLLFGAGLAPATEADTRKYGVEGEYRLTELMNVRAQVFRQATMEQGGQRDVASVETRYSLNRLLLRGVMQSVREETVSGESRSANLLGIGAAQSFFDGRLGLRADSEFNLATSQSSTDYPDRAVLGAELAVTPELSVVLEQELATARDTDSRHTRIGVRSRPWAGNSIESWLGHEMTESGARLFANTGLVQQWQVSQNWLLDAGFDQVKTLDGSAAPGVSTASTFNPAAPTALGNDTGDFTAWFAGATLRRDAWHASTRLERHTGEQVEKWNWLLGAARQLDDGKAVSASVSVLEETLPDGRERQLAEARLGAVWRPERSNWSVFNRLDLDVMNETGSGFDLRSRAIVENLHLNWQHDRHEAGAHVGLRLSSGQFDSDVYEGFTALGAVHYRFDLNSRWDIGTHASVRRSVSAGVSEYSVGVEVGRSFARQAWVSIGYNLAGFTDDDFVGAEYSAQGPYLKFRMHIDQRNVERFLAFVRADARRSPDPAAIARR